MLEELTRFEIGLLGIVFALALMTARIQIGVALGIVAFVGISLITSPSAAWGILSSIPHNFVANWSLSAVPMFLLMGFIASEAGLTKGLFVSARIVLGRVPGSLASATVVASAMFASASGSSVATAAAFSRIAIPEMMKSNYQAALATGAVAAAGTLGSLIPPSVLLIIYGIFTETSIGALFVAGFIPGVISALIYILMITIRAKINPEIAPIDSKTYTREETVSALKDVWPLPVLIVGVLGGIFFGVFTPTEAGAVGAILTSMIAIFRGAMTLSVLRAAATAAVVGTSTIYLIAIGASMFSIFMALSTVPNQLAESLIVVIDNVYLLILSLSVLFIILGMFVESISLMLIILPIVLPLLLALNVNMVWFGIIVVKLLEIGLVTPPLGMNVYVIKSSLGDKVDLRDIFKGVWWFIAMDIVALALLVAFPILVLFLPSLMF